MTRYFTKPREVELIKYEDNAEEVVSWIQDRGCSALLKSETRTTKEHIKLITDYVSIEVIPGQTLVNHGDGWIYTYNEEELADRFDKVDD